MPKNKLNAVIYARFSSSSQREESIEDQLRVCNEYATREGYNIIGNYCDYAISGRTDERPEFLRMINDSQKHLFNYIIVYRLDRFARNRVDSVIYKSKLAKNKVHVLSATECIPEGSDGVLIEALHEALAQKYSDDLSTIIRRGQEGNAENCKSNGAYPFGYKVNPDTRQLELDNDKAPIVKHIFEIIASGGTYDEALEYATKMGYPKSKNWIYGILRNERYKGIYIYKNHRVQGGMPAIVSDELFTAANKTRVRHLTFPKIASIKYLLTNKASCALCGNLLTGSYSISKSGAKYYYYICNGKKRLKICNTHSIKKEFLESTVVQMLYSFIFTKDICNAVIDAAFDFMEKNNPVNTNIAALNNKISEVTKKINNIMQAIEAGIITDTTKERLQELEAQKKSFQQSIIEEKLKAPALMRNQLEYYFENLRKGNISDRKFQKYLVDNFLTHCYISDHDVTAVINLSGRDNANWNITQSLNKVCDHRNFWWR